jgi:hypothetical protein
MQWFLDNWELLAVVLVNLLAVATAVARLTPSTTDDEWIAKIEQVVRNIVDKKPQ